MLTLSLTLLWMIDSSEAQLLKPFDGQQLWQGKEWANQKTFRQAAGYVNYYYDDGCAEPMFLPAIFLQNDTRQIVGLTLLLVFVFVGVNVLSEKLMKAIAQICSSSEITDVFDSEGKLLNIQMPIWNSSLAYVTLLAFGSAAPEIFLCFFSTFSDIDKPPNSLGPMTLIGSASFNLLIVGGISVAAANEAKTIFRFNSFLITAVFATFAYVWAWIVLCINTPGNISFTEAILTLIFYGLLLCGIFVIERITPEFQNDQKERDENRKRICKHKLGELAQLKNPSYIIDLATGYRQGSDMDDVERIKQYFRIVLEVEDLSKVELAQMVQVFKSDNPVQYLAYREYGHQVKPFTQLHQSSLHLAEQSKEPNKIIGFRSPTYCIPEGESVVVTVVKYVKEDVSFWIMTQDDTAQSPIDYAPKRELMTMSAEQREREIVIMTYDNEDEEPDRSFKVVLLNERNNTQFEGTRSACTVTILDDDGPGYIGFDQDTVCSSRRQKTCKVNLVRKLGASGYAKCVLLVTSVHEKLDGKKAPQPYKKEHEVYFADCQNYKVVELELPPIAPSCPENEHIYFIVELKPQTNHTEVINFLPHTKRNFCVVEVCLTDKDKELDMRMMIIKNFMRVNNPSFLDQFRAAVMFGPTIDEYDVIDEVSFGQSVVHFISLPWKVLFALIPPVSCMGGWVTFITTVCLIGAVSFLVYEIVTLLGCLLNLHPCFQALTLVALGTSLPDCATSIQISSNQNMKYADATLNTIYGANAANIFVGLGLPWTIATIYYWGKTGTSYYFIGDYQTADLAFALVTFIIISGLVFIVLMLRRLCKAEIGGSVLSRYSTFFFFLALWVVFVILNTMNCYELLGQRDYFVTGEVRNLQATQVMADIYIPTEQKNCPIKTAAPSVKQTDSGVSMTWQRPQDVIRPSKFDLEVKTPKGIKLVNKYCDEMTLECKLSHQTLHFGLELSGCEKVQARVRGGNAQCDADWSEWSQSSAQVHGCPDQMTLSQGNRYKQILTVNWDSLIERTKAGCMNLESYEIEMKKPGQPWTDITDKKRAFKDLSIEARGLEPCTDYQFRGKAKNQMCSGKYSTPITIQTLCGKKIPIIKKKVKPLGGVPKRMSPIQADYTQGCRARFSWRRPVSSTPVNSYQIAVVAADKKYHTLKMCGGSEISCVIEMRTLLEDPFFLQPGENIAVKGQARNDKGWGPQSSLNQNSIVILGSPSAPTQGKQQKVTRTSIELTWKKSISAGTKIKYEIFRSVDGVAFVSLAETEVTTFTDIEIGSDKQYDYKIKAKNECGESEFLLVENNGSRVVEEIEITEVPTQIELKENSCKLFITWRKPRSDYQSRVQIKGAGNSWYDSQQCQRFPDKSKCIQHLLHLMKMPFNFAKKDKIEVRVAATYKGKQGPWVYAKNTVEMQGRPPKMSQVMIKKAGDTSIKINWMELQNVQPRIINYELNSWQKTLQNKLTTSYLMKNLKSKTAYSFKVRAVNSCGGGPFSTANIYELQQNAGQMDPVQVTLEGCAVRLNWNAPTEQIREFQLKLLDGNGDYQQLSSLCGTSPTTNTCLIPLNILMEPPFSLRGGEKVKVIASANTRAKGWTKYSSVLPSSPALFRRLVTLSKPIKLSQSDESVIIGWTNIGNRKTEVYVSENGESYKIEATLSRDINKYTFKRIGKTEVFTFKVAGSDECNNGLLSPELQVVFSNQAPASLSRVTTTIQGCAVLIQWQRPLTGTFNHYQVSVQSKDSTFYPLKKCGKDPNEMSCLVPMSDLEESPFNRMPGAYIIVSVSACNGATCGPPSLINGYDAVQLRTNPKPVSVNIDKWLGGIVMLSWNTVEGSTYSVYENKGEQYRFVEGNLAVGRYQKSGLNPQLIYAYKVQVENICGKSDYSQPVSTRLAVKNTMEPVSSTLVDNCHVKFEWEKAKDATEYMLILKSGKGSPFTLCETHTLSCVVTMSTFQRSPYFLRSGDSISDRVTVQAKNAAGWGQPSLYQQSAAPVRMPQVPEIGLLSQSQTSMNSVNLSWEKISSATSYDIYSDFGNTSHELVLISTVYENKYSAVKLDPDLTYKYEVRIQNECGMSSSKPTKVKINY